MARALLLRPELVCGFFVLLFFTILLLHSRAPIFPSSFPPSKSSSKLSNPKSGTRHGSAFIWQLPQEQARAVLFLAHGCGCRATFFWDRSPNCVECVGLPEERIYVLRALQRRYAVIAVSSTGSCWNRGMDTKKVVSILSSWIRENQLDDLPVVALGASSGGYFVSTLALNFKFKAVVLMISEGHFEAMDFDSQYPPTLFVHMPRDERRASGVSRAMQILKDKGVNASEIQCRPLPLNPEFLSQRIPGLSKQKSEKIYAALQQADMVDEDGSMRGDGRAVNWQSAVRNSKILQKQRDGRLELEHHIQEELNVAYAYHEMTSLPADEIFSWFEKAIV